MKHFLILFKDIPIDKTSVKSGNNSAEVITAVRCVNVGLFVSGNLRRDVVLSLGMGPSDSLTVISFPGISLKRVSPDERSISFFLLKARTLAEEMMENSSETMDNGIEVHRTNLERFVESVDPSVVYISDQDSINIADDYNEYEDALLIYISKDMSNSLSIDGKWTKRDLRYFPHPERFIMDVNMCTDMKKAS
jgi:tRNA pseudouridine-54 N-methylase